ncbi:histidine kinase [Marivirga sp. S37H4]|uniref:Histidine kinase n=1 Tax=Marivirga aurantiaca TaxID=2802615 RepID=A0A935CAB1_9BACT|nr:histidine kinase [Marivirga aurantiaca]MBK6266097.1 histidine kinase [Marivirga aurantiaca]
MRTFFNRKYFWLEYTIIFSISIIGGFVRYLMWDFLQLKGEMHAITVFVSFIFIAVSWELFRATNQLLNKKMPYEQNLTIRIFTQLLIGVVIILILRHFVFQYAAQFLSNPMDKMFNVVTYAVYIILSFFINFIFFTTYFIQKWKEGLVRSERLEKEKAQVQFDNLKNQLNPHFLFNALSSLNSLIHENQDLATHFLQNLSKVYRYVLQHKVKNSVLLSYELEFIQHFIFLLETRFQEAISITIQVDEEVKKYEIVPVTLQVLLENAVKHNIIDLDHPLKIEIRNIGHYLVISNTMQPKKTVEGSNHQGLENLKSFYRILTNDAVEISATDGLFIVRIPLLKT